MKPRNPIYWKDGRLRPEVAIWNAMRSRCADLENPEYGGRGITVCERWHSFENFLADVGERPPNPPEWDGKQAYYSLDRIDTNGHYEPTNVRWATQSEQKSNRRPRAKRKPDREDRPLVLEEIPIQPRLPRPLPKAFRPYAPPPSGPVRKDTRTPARGRYRGPQRTDSGGFHSGQPTTPGDVAE